MSAIQKELCKATGIDSSKYGDKERPALHADLVRAVNKLPDSDWKALTAAAQDWFNEAADATKAKKDLPEFPDFKDDPEPETRSRRRSSSEDDDKGGSAKGETMAVEKLQEGDRVKLTTKRGKVIEGEVVEQSKRKEFVVVKGSDGKEDEIDWDKVDSVEVFHGTAGTKEEDAGPAEGDEVKFTTKRGKSVQGIITELTAETIVIDKTDDFDLDRIDGDITIVKKAGGGDSKGNSSRRSSSDGDEKNTRSRGGTKENGEKISVGGRIRELLAQDPARSKDEVDKILTKEKIEYRPASLNIIYRDCQNLIGLLRENGHMSKAR
jgi:hypothetical protein